MSDFDEFTEKLFEDIRRGVPIVGSDNSFDGLAGQHPSQSSSRPAALPSATTSTTMVYSNERPAWDTIVPQDFPRRSDYLGRTPHHMPPVATPNTLTVDNVLVPPPTIVRRNRTMEDYSYSWHAPERATVDGRDVVGDTSFPYPLSAPTDIRGNDYTEGNALRHMNHSTRASNFEEIFPIASLAPVAEQSFVQGPWPTMTSRATSQRHPTQTPIIAADHNNQFFPFPFDGQPPNMAPETLHQFRSAPDTMTGYGLDSFTQPSFIGDARPSQALSWPVTQRTPSYQAQAHREFEPFQTPGPSSYRSPLMPWPFGAEGGNSFPSDPTPSRTGYPSFASTAEQPFNRGLWMPSQVPQAGATYPPPLPISVTEPSFGVASQEANSSTSAPSPSNIASTPYFLAKVKCHLCREGFRRESKLREHCRTNKHRLRELQAENPGVVVTAAHLIPDCFCPSCGKGYATPYNVTRHLKTCRSRIESSQSGSQD